RVAKPTTASRPRRLKPAPTAEQQGVGVGFSRRVRDSAGFSGFAPESIRSFMLMSHRFVWGLGCLFLITTFGVSTFFGQVYKDNLSADHPAIRYFQQSTNDRVAKLWQDIQAGKVKLEKRDDGLGLLPDLLKRLDLNGDSQMLVFSKTSFQAPKISPENPRAIYFNDDIAIGYVR